MKTKAVFILIVLALLLSSCSPPDAPSGDPSITITDSTGHSVTLESLPQRVVIAGKATFMVQDTVYLFEEANERIVGIENRRQSAYSFLPIIDPMFEEKNILEINAGPEQIAVLQPDVVILKSFMEEKLGAPLESIGIPVLYVDLENPESFFKDVATLCGIFGDEARANELVEFYQSRIDKITQVTSDLTAEDKPTVLLLEYSDKGGDVAFKVPPATWLQTSLVEMAGGNPVWVDESVGGGWMIVTVEQIAAWNPDKIFIIDYSGNATDVVNGLKTDSIWGGLSAVQNDELYAFASDVYSWDQPDTRWILGLQWLATKIQPDLFSDIDILSEVETFYSMLYRMDSASIQEDIIPAITGDVP